MDGVYGKAQDRGFSGEDWSERSACVALSASYRIEKITRTHARTGRQTHTHIISIIIMKTTGKDNSDRNNGNTNLTWENSTDVVRTLR